MARRRWLRTNLVDPASSHMLASKTKPCMSCMHDKTLGPFWMTLGSVWMTLGSRWDDFGVTLGSCWGHFGIILGPLWDHVGVTLGPFWGNFAIILVLFGILSG